MKITTKTVKWVCDVCEQETTGPIPLFCAQVYDDGALTLEPDEQPLGHVCGECQSKYTFAQVIMGLRQ